MSSVPLDPLIAFGEHLVALVYSITLATKMFHTNLKMRANQLIITSITFSMVVAVLILVADVYELNNSNTNEVSDLFGVAFGFQIAMIASLVWLLDIRNRILICNTKVLLASRVLITIMAISALLGTVPFWIYIGNPQDAANLYASTLLLNICNAGTAVWGISLSLYDIMSSVYLWKYYQRYFFSSKRIMDIMRPQMEYRRNWIMFVIFCDILTMVLMVVSATNTYDETTTSFLTLSFLFQLNTMIDFVRFDTVRHEITIRDYTMSLGDGIEKEDIDSLIPKVC